MLKLDGMNLMCDETLIATVPMATISILETALKGQEETAILLEEQARRIATLQESLRQVCHNQHSNDRVIMQEVDRLVEERNDLRWRLENAELLIERLETEATLRTAEDSSVVDSTPAKQPEGTTKLDKALQNTTVVKRIIMENSCPSEFGLKDCEYNPETGCSLCCEDCWNQEVEE